MFENWGAHIPHWIQPKEQERKSEHERDMGLIIVRRFPMYGEPFSILSDVPVAMPMLDGDFMMYVFIVCAGHIVHFVHSVCA